MITIPKGFLKFSGFMLLLGGIMGFTGQLVHLGDVPETVKDIPEFLKGAINTHVLLAYASTFILMGLPALFLRQAASLKWWGWVAFPLLFIGLMLEIFHGPVQIIAYPIIFDFVHTAKDLQHVTDLLNNMAIDQFPLQLAVFIPLIPGIFIGLILLGISTYRAKVLPKAPAIFTLVVLVIQIIGMIVPIHIHLLEISFAYIHLIFVWFGAILAFEKAKTISIQEENKLTL
ncbi:hypothetical protein COJ85_24860 [Bacillus sp. AFS076308]|uniref:hypothetical protein n=1 Tax=unclassified Bacillus (in: firmicutes) TaxID=185979 RepID=UPI000BF2D25B|nr:MULTISPECIES: hypothetical protein [unclassified Bacillus (in: firmicutes)]PFN96106.1 hypothetical protein COJ85_24860 [Bacillus sp. AFS076308]PGV55992.1 hypothetical protein COD92_00175 [Bacillus sp. AFS037270]